MPTLKSTSTTYSFTIHIIFFDVDNVLKFRIVLGVEDEKLSVTKFEIRFGLTTFEAFKVVKPNRYHSIAEGTKIRQRP